MTKLLTTFSITVWALLFLPACVGSGAGIPEPKPFDTIIRHGTVYDGTGAPPRPADVGIRGDRIDAVGDLSAATAANEIDASGRAVAPGFINVLSWANESLNVDGRGMSDLKQGVTLEIFGEGESGGPLNEQMKTELRRQQADYKFEIGWTTLGEYLDALVRRGISPNVASFVGATTVRVNVLGEDDRDPTPAQLARMQQLVRDAMREGALGVGSSLVYAPAFFAETPELIALAKASAEFGGGYVSHVRNESSRLGQAIDELIEITRAAGGHGEAYHLKAAGEPNWDAMALAIKKIAAARADGVSVGANMYTYTAGSTGLDAAMPLWVQAGGLDAWVARLKDPQLRARVRRGHNHRPRDRGSLACRDGVFPDERRECPSRTRATVGEFRLRLGSAGAGGCFSQIQHPSAGLRQFRAAARQVRARRTGPYARRGGAPPDAASSGKLEFEECGCLEPACYADVVVFDPTTVADKATFDQPMQYAVGVDHVLVNGVHVISNGQHTGAKPGRVVRGPGFQP